MQTGASEPAAITAAAIADNALQVSFSLFLMQNDLRSCFRFPHNTLILFLPDVKPCNGKFTNYPFKTAYLLIKFRLKRDISFN